MLYILSIMFVIGPVVHVVAQDLYNKQESILIGARKNMGCISINTHFLDEEKDEFPLSIDGVRKWVQNEIGIHISELIISLSEQGEYDQSQNEILAGLYEELDALLYNLAGG